MAERDAPRPKRKSGAPDLPESPGPVEIAMAAAASGRPLPEAARAVLEKHAALIDIQCHHEREEIAFVRVQRITRWLILGAVAALLLGICALVRSAATGHALVVEPFNVPPALAQAGINGEVMATRVMDQIADMQERAISTRPPSTYSTNWGEDINVAIPQTGVTLGDFKRLLRGWFGNETRISGEAVRLGDKWNVTARVTGHTAVAATDADLEAATKQVAEGVFRQTQPFRYVIYLGEMGRATEAMAAARQLAFEGPEEERPWGLVALANHMAPPDFGLYETLDIKRRAAEAVPNFPMPVGNYAGALESLGRWEEALKYWRQSERLVGNGKALSEDFRGIFVAIGSGQSDILTGAFGNAARQFEAAGRTGTPIFGSQYLMMAAGARFAQYDVAAGDRNFASAAEILGHTNRLGNVPDSAASSLFWRFATTQMRIFRAGQLGDAALLQAEIQRGLPIVEQYRATLSPLEVRDFDLQFWPGMAATLVRGGMAAEIERRLKPMPLDCYPCAAGRGEAAVALGKRGEALRWFAHARKLGPSLPYADEALGRALMRWGDNEGALAAFRRASRIEPRFADAHMGAGDALRRLNRPDEAAAAYAVAAKHAPRWGRLYLNWANALWNSGRRTDAVAKLEAGSTMSLGREDRLRLAAMREKARQA